MSRFFNKNQKNCFTMGLLCMQIAACIAQIPAERARCANLAFDKEVLKYVRFTVPTIDPAGVLKLPQHRVLLDAREKAEFEISHLPNAQWAGYEHFELKKWAHLNKNTPIVVYCSIGYRSEKVGEQLQKAGFSQVYNLYGSIFEWVNQGYPVMDVHGKPTHKIHTYNASWSKWVWVKKMQKVW